jgi:hypothetical protein
MKKYSMMMVALVGMIASGSAFAEDAAVASKKPQEANVAAATANKLSAEEMSFAAKLSEKNRKAFEQFTAAQRKAAMTETKVVAAAPNADKNAPAKKALTADEAVQKVMNDSHVTQADKKEKAPEKAPAPVAEVK